MSELKNVLKDVKSGALPFSEIPQYLAYLFRGIAWLALFIIFIGMITLIVVSTR